MKPILLLTLMVLTACGGNELPPKEPAPTPEELARSVCELAKPGFDAIGAALAAGKSLDHTPLNQLPGAEGVFRGTRMGYFDASEPDFLRKEEIKGEPDAMYRFDDLDLTCWTYSGKADHNGLPFEGGWVVMRVYSAREDPEWAEDKVMVQVTMATMHITAIGDVRWPDAEESAE